MCQTQETDGRKIVLLFNVFIVECSYLRLNWTSQSRHITWNEENTRKFRYRLSTFFVFCAIQYVWTYDKVVLMPGWARDSLVFVFIYPAILISLRVVYKAPWIDLLHSRNTSFTHQIDVRSWKIERLRLILIRVKDRCLADVRVDEWKWYVFVLR